MGTSAIYRTKTHLDKNEIDKICSKNNYINTIFSKEKNDEDCLTIRELNIITNGLIKEKILKKIIQICASKKEKLTFDDFCYFYALLNTISFEAKLNFLLDFIFIKKEKLPKEKYIKKINKYFLNSELLTDIFLDKELIEKASNLTRDDVYSFIEKKYKKELKGYPLYIKNKTLNQFLIKNSSTNSKENSEINIEDNNNTLILINNTQSNENSNTSINSVKIAFLKNEKYDNLSGEFKNIEKRNNGVFPISLFEDMLREIRIDDEMIKMIGDYLRKKTKKSFFNFELLKEILLILIPEDNTNKENELIKGIFFLMSYPKNSISKNTMQNIFKNINLDKNDKKDIEDVMELKNFLKNNYDKNILKSLNNLKYLKYIFFKVNIKDRYKEYECMEILIKNSVADYILERLQYDTKFYLIDMKFWKRWQDLMNTFKEDSNYTNYKKIEINTKYFADRYGKISSECEFSSDYLIVSETIYNLFTQWYGPPEGPNVIRYKIYLDQDKNISDDAYTSNKRKKKIYYNNNNNQFCGIEKKTNRRFELELYPIFIRFYHFIELLRISNYFLNTMKHKLRNMHNKNEDNCIPYSRKTRFEEIRKKLINNVDINNIRFWVYYNERLEKVGINDSLEELGIENKAIVLIEEKISNTWPSEKIKTEEEESLRENDNDDDDIYKVGLINIGNTCFMNSVLQIFLNIEQIRDIFLYEDEEKYKSFLSFILNTEDKDINNVVKKKGYLIIELINLLRDKWIERKNVLNPRKLKEICGEYNPMFKTNDQQDAHDFYTFLINQLHEETNIKYNNNTSNDIENSETIDTTEIDLGNECWANNVRKNASYFYALFMGQLKSTLICSECDTKKIKFEPFSALEVPIPEDNSIIIEIILFRLPYSLRKFDFDKFNDDDIAQPINSSRIPTKESINVKKKNKKNKRERSERNSMITYDNLTINEDNKDKNEIFNNPLNLNIPLRLKIEVSRKEKCSSIIDKLKCMQDLNIEKNYNFTEFIMISQGKYINEDLIIDETFGNLNKVFVYELLNIQGIINIYDYEELDITKIMPLKKQEINNIENENKKAKNEINNNKLKENMNNKNLNVPLFNINIRNNKEYDSCEILLPIIHRYKSEINKSIIPITYQYFYNFQDFIILNSSNSVKPYHLYEIMWKKYMYFLNCPSNYDNNVWWKIKKRDKKPVPFIITIINKENGACAYCPWFRLCTGCILNPSNSEYITINSNSVIVIEWDKDVFTKEINKNNLSLIMDHNSTKTVSDKTKNESNKISIDDCLKLFTKSEELKDIQCEKCKKKTLFKKTLEIERLPKYLVIVLKRFKYILTSPVKITNLIHFPLEDLPLRNYLSQKNMNYTYNLFGVINHSGTLEGGHYNSTFLINNSWFLFDDNFVEEIKGGIETNKVYMLIYKSMKTDSQQKDQNLNFVGLMDRAYRIYLGRTKFKYLFNYIYDENNNIINEYLNSCEFYYGEPVIVDGKNGFIVDIKKEKEKKNNVVEIKVKLKKGFFNERINPNKIFKETFKKKSHIDVELFLNKGKNNKNIKIKESDIVCGSQVCFIF